MLALELSFILILDLYGLPTIGHIASVTKFLAIFSPYI